MAFLDSHGESATLPWPCQAFLATQPDGDTCDATIADTTTQLDDTLPEYSVNVANSVGCGGNCEHAVFGEPCSTAIATFCGGWHNGIRSSAAATQLVDDDHVDDNESELEHRNSVTDPSGARTEAEIHDSLALALEAVMQESQFRQPSVGGDTEPHSHSDTSATVSGTVPHICGRATTPLQRVTLMVTPTSSMTAPASWDSFWVQLTNEGWRIDYGSDGDMYYMPPGVVRGACGARRGVDYFDTKMQVMRYIRDAGAMVIEVSPEESQAETHPARAQASPSSVQPSTTAALAPPDASLPWDQLWPQLVARGWRIELGPRGNHAQAYYLPPQVVRGVRSRNRVDYFDSKRLVVQHLRDNARTLATGPGHVRGHRAGRGRGRGHGRMSGRGRGRSIIRLASFGGASGGRGARGRGVKRLAESSGGTSGGRGARGRGGRGVKRLVESSGGASRGRGARGRGVRRLAEQSGGNSGGRGAHGPRL